MSPVLLRPIVLSGCEALEIRVAQKFDKRPRILVLDVLMLAAGEAAVSSTVHFRPLRANARLVDPAMDGKGKAMKRIRCIHYQS
jgi:hypothetical protein